MKSASRATVAIFPEFENIWILAKGAPEGVDFDGDPSRVSVSGDKKAIVFHPWVDDREVSVGIDVHPTEPPLSLESWDHVVLAALKVGKAPVIVSNGLPDTPEHRIDLEPGQYSVRVEFAGLGTPSEAYAVDLWKSEPGHKSGRKTLKQWPGFLPAPAPDRIFSSVVWGMVEHPPKKGRFILTFAEGGVPAADTAILLRKDPGFAEKHRVLASSLESKRLVTVVKEVGSDLLKQVEFSDETKLVPNVLKIRI